MKLYETTSEKYAVDWMLSHLQEGQPHTVYVSWSLSQYSINTLVNGSDRSILLVDRLPLSENSGVLVEAIENESMVIFSRYDIDSGFQSGYIGTVGYGQRIITRFDDDVLMDFQDFKRLYDNGKMMLYGTHS